MFKKDDSVAILYQRVDFEEVEVLFPVRALIGKTDEKMGIFQDCISSQKYINTDILANSAYPEGFNSIIPLKMLRKKLKAKSVDEALKLYLASARECVFFYDWINPTLQCLPKEHFFRIYGHKVEYSVDKMNEILQKFYDGEIEDLNELLLPSHEDKNDDICEDEKEVDKFENLKIGKVIDEMTKSIISQDDAIKKIVTAIYKHKFFKDEKIKSNIFVYGPTGVGKTAIFKLLGKKFGFPVMVEDITRYTVAGYKGGDVEDILIKLYYNAGRDLEKAQKSILVLDEIDKKASGYDSQSSITTDGVLKSLLKIIEGETFDLNIDMEQTIQFDTSQLIVVACGAFNDLFEQRKETKIGFSKEQETKEDKPLEMEQFVKYGIPAEFMGRFGTIVKLDSLKYEDLYKILKISDLSPMRIYESAFNRLGIKLKNKDKIYETIVKKALRYNTGARALKTVVDDAFSSILYSVFDHPNEQFDIEMGEDIVENPKSFKMIKKEQISE